MKYFFITGTSKGLGNSITKLLLDNPDNRITGISRSNSINHDSYRHFHLDLSDIGRLKASLDQIFPALPDAEKIVLINNAGILGEVGHVGKISNESLQEIFNVNMIAPGILINEFIRRYYNCNSCHKLIINVSSGAGKKPTDGWAGYCSTKAALDMFSEVVSVEKQKDHQNLKILSVAPGIVDTPMQEEIRKVNRENFSRVDEFIEYKKENMLVSAEKVARKFLYIIENAQAFHEPLISVRNI